MSLRSFHIFFILTALAFMIFFTYWSGTQYLHGESFQNLSLAVSSGAAFVLGVPYLFWFIRKTKALG